MTEISTDDFTVVHYWQRWDGHPPHKEVSSDTFADRDSAVEAAIETIVQHHLLLSRIGPALTSALNTSHVCKYMIWS